MARRFDVVVMGGGSAGEVAAAALAETGRRVALVERELVGGECPYWACMPSKALLRATEAGLAAARVPGSGVTRARPRLRPAAHWRDHVVAARDDSGPTEALLHSGVTVVRGAARLSAPGRVETGNDDLLAKSVLVATGSLPDRPLLEGLDGVEYWTSREATTATTLPRSLVVLGGGAVGVEMSQVYARFGSHVTLLCRGPRLLMKGAPEVSEVLRAALEADGVDVRLGRPLKRVARGREGVELTLDDGSKVQAERLLLATGRHARLDDIDLAAVGAKAGKAGLQVDDHCLAAPGVWAAGDVTGVAMFTHLAKYQAQIAANNLAGYERRADYRSVPLVTFTDPETVSLGLTEARAREQGIAIMKGTVDLGHTSRGEVWGTATMGVLVLIADAGREILVGAHAAGPLVSELMHEMALAIRAETPLRVLRDVIHAFPTFSESIAYALGSLEPV